MSKLTPLIKIIYNPFEAMAELAARRPYIFGAALALISTFAYYDTLAGPCGIIRLALRQMQLVEGVAAPFVFFIYRVATGIINSASPVFFLIVVFVPACLLAASFVDRRASFSTLLRQEYAAVVSCALYSWAVAHLLAFVVALIIYEPGRANPRAVIEAVRLAPLPYFVFLMMIGLTVSLKIGFGRAAGIVSLGALSLLAIPLLSRFLFLLTSPFLLILLIILIRNVFGEMVATQRAREEFERSLEAATLNPADAEAHYNLGLIYQQRGQTEEAKASFARAIEIRPDEVDAHYQLGRIARREGRLADAIAHFDAVVRENAGHSQNEVWREIGRTYLQAGQYDDARAAFERFLERRPSDAEGRYHYGLTLYNLGRADEAANEMRACIEAVRTSPTYKYRADKRWMDEAEKFLRAQEVRSP
ncbi:MAG TPA: tetratricopeptide repeat protein [Blastocatellia bacterium]|nr:tetratricopeptide repeat protein [Blastocatellia bacterium]